MFRLQIIIIFIISKVLTKLLCKFDNPSGSRNLRPYWSLANNRHAVEFISAELITIVPIITNCITINVTNCIAATCWVDFKDRLRSVWGAVVVVQLRWLVYLASLEKHLADLFSTSNISHSIKIIPINALWATCWEHHRIINIRTSIIECDRLQS